MFEEDPFLDTTMFEQQHEEGEEEESPTKLLPWEIIEEILARVPAKSLVRFRCVSKSFLKLTKNSQFITLHFNKSQETTNYMVLKDCYWNIYLIDCNSCDQITNLNPPWENKNSIQCLSSCNGLLCVEDAEGYIYLWNPCTNKHMIIHEGHDRTCRGEDSGSSYGLGFGYNSVLKDYEIVKIVCDNGSRCRSVLSVYNVRKGEWLVTEKVPYKVRYMREGLFFNGAIHWIGLPNIVIAYDLGARKFRKMKLPDCKKVNWINVSVLDGYLCVLCDCDSHVEVWVMKEYGVCKSWVMLFADAELKNYLGVTVKGEFLLQETGGDLCLYDPRAESFRDLVTDDATQYLSLGTRFVGSLLPLPSKLCSKRNCLHQDKLSHLGQQISSVRPFKVASDDSESIFPKNFDENDECSSPCEDGLGDFVSEGDGNTCKPVRVAERLANLHGGCTFLNDSGAGGHDGSYSSSEDELGDFVLTSWSGKKASRSLR